MNVSFLSFEGVPCLAGLHHRDLTWRPMFANRFVFNKSFPECESPFCLRSLCRCSRHFRLNARLRPTTYCERVSRKLLRQQSAVINTGKHFTGTFFKWDWISPIVQLQFQVYLTNLSLGLLINGQHYICNICRAMPYSFLFIYKTVKIASTCNWFRGIVSHLSAFKLFLRWPSAFSNQSFAGRNQNRAILAFAER